MQRRAQSPELGTIAARLVSFLLLLVVGALMLPSARALSSDWRAGALGREAAMSVVRETLAGAEESTATHPDPVLLRDTRRVYVSVFVNGRRASQQSAAEEDTARSLFRASHFARAEMGNRALPRDAWLKIDVVTAEEDLPNALTADDLEGRFEPGLDGVRAEPIGLEDDSHPVGSVLPSDGITEGWWSPRPMSNTMMVGGVAVPATRGGMGLQAIDIARTRLRTRLGATASQMQGVRLIRFRTDSFLARASGGAPIRLVRGVPDTDLTPDAEAIRESFTRGTNWLARDVGPDGRFQHYSWLPSKNAPDPSDPYNLIRHIAAAWALEKQGARYARPDWVAAGNRALDYVLPSVVPGGGESNGVPRYVLLSPEGNRGGLGETATAVLALLARTNRSPADEAKMLGLAATLEWMVRDDGGFYATEADAQARKKVERDFLLYEPGEALLALVEIATLHPDQRHWLVSSLRAAAYQTGCFEDAWRGTDCYGEETGSRVSRLFSRDRIPPIAKSRYADRVHWNAQALERLGALTGNRHWAQVAFEMGETILATATPPNDAICDPSGVPLGPSPVDYIGSFTAFGAPPRTVATGSRGEALNAARRAAIQLGRDPRPFEAALMLSAGFQIRNQLSTTSAYFAPDAEALSGSFRAGLTDEQLRVDYTQHIVNSMGDSLEWLFPTGASPSPDR